MSRKQDITETERRILRERARRGHAPRPLDCAICDRPYPSAPWPTSRCARCTARGIVIAGDRV